MFKLIIALNIVFALAAHGQSVFNPVGPLSFCPKVTTQACNVNKRYSEIDGSCNNLATAWAGRASTPYKRYFRNAYDDNWNAPRTRASNLAPLQNPRAISRIISLDRTSFDSNQIDFFYSHLFPLFGQFLAHDLTLANTVTDSTGKGVNCDCGSTSANCLSFSVPSNDNILRQACIKFTRTQNSAPSFACDQKTREQLNALSAFIDGSQVYGSSATVTSKLRAGFKGLLQTSQGILPGRMYLPIAQGQTCGDNFQVCFMAGESRTNENLGLLGIQVLFMREHNRIATALSALNPGWTDESLFQETRKIVIAIMQNIIFKEWLPLVIGQQYAINAGVVPIIGDGFFQGYNPNVNPSIANEFATAAFRFGHTLIRQKFSRFSSTGVLTASLNISQTIFRTNEAFNTAAGGIESVFYGLLNDASSKYDSNFVDTLQNHLFEFKDASGNLQAFDLLAMNINRGRDHGIPSYNTIRTGCGLRQAIGFQDLLDVMPQAKIDLLKRGYMDVNDIDFYAGGLMETPIQGGAVGPTFACIIASQFAELKKGDRFYYENGPSGASTSTAFTLAQLREIKKMTMSRIICNDYDLTSIQPNAFVLPTISGNLKVSCSNLPTLNLTPWKF